MVKALKIIFLILLFIVIFGLFSVEIRDPDFWWHLKTGEYIYQMRSIPETDPFAFTSLPKDPINPESKRIKFILTQYWLAQVIFYRIYDLFGFQGIIYLRALILTLLIFLIYKSIRREGLGSYLSVALLIPAIIIFHAFTGERPQIFSFLFAFLVVFLIEGFRKTSSVSMSLNESLRVSGLFYLLPVPFIMLLWANLHGGFILGILIIIGYLFSEWIKHLSKRFGKALPIRSITLLTTGGIISIVSSIINPNSYNVIPFLIELQKGLYKGMIIEVMSPLNLLSAGFYEPEFITYFVLLSVCILLFLINIKKLDLTDVLILVSFTIMSLYASRSIPFFTPVALLMIARYGTRIMKARLYSYLSPSPIPSHQGRGDARGSDQERSMYKPSPLVGEGKGEGYNAIRRRAEILLPVLLSIVLTFVVVKGDLFKSGVRSNKYPEGAAQFLKENRISGNMFNPYVWGGYLIWALYPDYKVFIDGRGLIEEVFFQEVNVMEASPKNLEGLSEWKAVLKAYNVDFIVTFSVKNFTGQLVPLIPALLNDLEWHLVYMDNISLIFLRGNPENKEIINRFGLPKEWLWNEVAVEAALKAKDYGRNINFLITMGDAFFAKRSYREAREAYLEALKIEPESSVVKKRLDFLGTQGY